MNALRRIGAIARKEVQQLSRDRLSLGMVIGIPLMQILLFGYAINMDVRHLDAAVLDMAGTSASRALIADAVASQVIAPAEPVASLPALAERLRRGDAVVGLLIPADFDQRRSDPSRSAAQIWIDGSDPQILASARQLAQMPRSADLQRAGPTNDPPAPFLALRPFYNPERRTAVFVVPGLLGVVLTMTMIMFTSMAIVRERERGNLEFLITTPIRPAELMLGKIAPYVVIGLVQATVILLVGRVLFHVPMVGNLASLYAAVLVFIAASLGLGLLISTRVQSQFQAMQMTFFIFLPSMLLSGFMFPFSGMPRAMQWLAEVLPLTHFLRLARGIELRGASLAELGHELGWLALIFTIVTTIATLRFKRRLD